jgi:uncharacterized LabA/DUF88 family protein
VKPIEDVHVFVDNSNVWIEGKRVAGRHSKPSVESNGRYRIDYGNLLGVVQDGRFLADVPKLYGSEPPPNDSVWKMIKSKGFEVEVFKRNIFNKEKGIDMKMGLDIGKLLYTSGSPGILIIVAGDADFVPVVEAAREIGWKTEAWYWSNAAKALKRAVDRFGELDAHLYRIGFDAQ